MTTEVLIRHFGEKQQTSSQPAEPPGGQDREAGAGALEVEPQRSALWRLFDE